MFKIKVKTVLTVLLLLLCINLTTVYAEGERSTPYRAWTNHQFTLQEYGFIAPKKVEMQLLEFYKGTQANSMVSNEFEYNAVPAYDEEWLLMKFNMKYISGPEEPLSAYDIIWSESSFFTKNGTNISPLDTAYFVSNFEGLGEYDVSFYPGGESVVWYGILVKKTVGYPLIRIGTGFDSTSYSSIYSWFYTDPNTKSTVTFNSNGGSAVSSQSVAYNSKSVKPVNPTKSGYTFGGWYKENTYINLFDFIKTPITRNITLYAKWIPATPTSVKALSSSYNSININWGAVTGASGYQIYRATSSTGPYSYLSTTTTLRSYKNTGITTNRTYYYKVRAYTTVGSVKVYSNFSTAINAKPIPATPTSVKATRISSTSIKLTWGSVTGASGYELYKSTASSGTYSLLKSTTNLYYTNSGLIRSKTYYYKIRSYRTVGTIRVYSNWTSVVYAKL